LILLACLLTGVAVHILDSKGVTTDASESAEPDVKDLANPVSVETDHGGDSSDVSTDELVLIRSDGSKDNLTKNGCMERVPVLSHDNSTLAFLRRIDSNEDGVVNWDDEVELWIMHLGNRAEAHLAKNLTDPSETTWHPKKQILGFIATDGNRGRGLYSYDLATKALNRLADEAGSWPAWSADGEYIAFYDAKNRVVLFSLADGVRKILTKDVGNGWALYWTTDNRMIFTEEGIGWQVYTPGTKKPIPLDETQHKKLTTIDQAKFGWASTQAEQAASSNGDKPSN
jgi:Tol biopolymer transport system component